MRINGDGEWIESPWKTGGPELIVGYDFGYSHSQSAYVIFGPDGKIIDVKQTPQPADGLHMITCANCGELGIRSAFYATRDGKPIDPVCTACANAGNRRDPDRMTVELVPMPLTSHIHVRPT